MDSIFKALADPTRRLLLDSLRETPGQSLQDLEGQLEMSRFGVMKHLAVLEEAKLIVTHRKGRYKYHYLNALPLQEIMDRWTAPFLQRQARALTELKAKLEHDAVTGRPDFMMQIYIRCSGDALWDALTQAAAMAAYHFACDRVEGNAILGRDTVFIMPDGSAMLKQTTTALDPKSRIAMTFDPLFLGADVPSSHMAYRISPAGDLCKLTIEHYDIAPGQDSLAECWARLATSLKTYLETGSALRVAI